MNLPTSLLILLAAVLPAILWTAAALCGPEPGRGDEEDADGAIPFEVFAGFTRIETGNPVFAYEPPEWAAAAHAIVVDDTVHYLWARQLAEARRWVMMHSTAPTSDPAAVEHDPRNPILSPSPNTFDEAATEYPFPFWNAADDSDLWQGQGVRVSADEQHRRRLRNFAKKNRIAFIAAGNDVMLASR